MPPRPRNDLIPRPFLSIALASATLDRLPPPMVFHASILISNKGNSPAWTCYVELFTGSYNVEDANGRPLDDFTQHSHEITVLHEGEERELTISNIMPSTPMTWFAVVSDPLNDPKRFDAVDLDGHRQIARLVGTSLQTGTSPVIS